LWGHLYGALVCHGFDGKSRSLSFAGDVQLLNSKRVPKTSIYQRLARESSRGHRDKVISLRLILSATTVTLITISVITIGRVAEHSSLEALTAEIETRLILEARNLASISAEALLNDQPEAQLVPLVNDIVKGRPDLAFAVVLDNQKKIRGHKNIHLVGDKYQQLAELKPMPFQLDLKPKEVILGNAEVRVAVAPVRHSSGRILGTALIGFRNTYLNFVVTKSRKNLIWMTAALVCAGIATTLLLMSWLLRPVTILRNGLERIGQGDLDTPLILKDKTEFGLLAKAINGMAAQLKISQIEMLEKDRLEQEMALARRMQQSLLPNGATQIGTFVLRRSISSRGRGRRRLL